MPSMKRVKNEEVCEEKGDVVESPHMTLEVRLTKLKVREYREEKAAISILLSTLLRGFKMLKSICKLFTLEGNIATSPVKV